MLLSFTNEQLDKLSDLFLDLAKGSLLAAFALPFLTGTNFVIFFKLFIHGIILAYFSLKLLELKRR